MTEHEPLTLIEPAPAKGRGQITAAQYEYLMNPLKSTRVATRNQSGKQLSYLEAWDVKAHLTRIFGFGNWDLEMLEFGHVADRKYESNEGKPMVEVVYSARMQLVVRDPQGREIARYCEAAVGSAFGPDYLYGDHHDNALKTAASDATKRCAINLGTQFGLSLYDHGSKADVIRVTLVKPDGVEEKKDDLTPNQQANLAQSLGATELPDASTTNETPKDES
jgi:recombination DNA repair RAD52 pathway protein